MKSTRTLVIAALLVFAGFLVGLFSIRHQQSEPLPPVIIRSDSGYDGKTVRVTKVLDGDTIIISGGEKIRYEGIDAPEIKDKWGMEAFEFNRNLVQGKSVQLELDRDTRDVYNRLLAYIWIDNDLVNEKLLEEGYAKTYTVKGDKVIKYRNRLLQAEKWAREHHNGLWLAEWKHD